MPTIEQLNGNIYLIAIVLISSLILNLFQLWINYKKDSSFIRIKDLEDDLVSIKQILKSKDEIIEMQISRIDKLENDLFEMTRENSELKGLIAGWKTTNEEKQQILNQLKNNQ